ncbi:MAG: M23 family metallopeptidase [Helicobacteraceae bacterium]|jgi:hypothetical protein|nr:M23 family metallopeptidase [Helicobacteraceae bacterium]
MKQKRHYNPKRKRQIRIGITFAAAFLFVLFIAFSPSFEREAPSVEFANNSFWNLASPLEIAIRDNRELSSYRVALYYGETELTLSEGTLSGQNEVVLQAQFPPDQKSPPKESVKLSIEAVDASYWNLFRGNKTLLTYTLTIDRKNPVVNVVANSYGISLGGSALVVFEARDENIDEIKIVTKTKREFAAAPFYKSGFYAALIGRDIEENDWAAYVYASDLAGNRTQSRIPFFLKDTRLRRSNITLTKRFLEGKVEDMFVSHGPAEQTADALERFIFVNETLRQKSLKTIEDHTKPKGLAHTDRFSVERFAPLASAAQVAGFGDRRDYYYDGKPASHSFHYGIDLASVKEAAIKASNGGSVIFAEENGVYGNMSIVDHGLGLYTIYGHCTQLHVSAEDAVKAGDRLGTTGTTGFALGDHVHFEVRVQGVAVTPIEWMDSNWIKANIVNIQEDAKTVINGRE